VHSSTLARRSGFLNKALAVGKGTAFGPASGELGGVSWPPLRQCVLGKSDGIAAGSAEGNDKEETELVMVVW
jgi:hypothetical protein